MSERLARTRGEWPDSELAGAVERLARRYARADGVADWREVVDQARDDLREAAGQWWLDGAIEVPL